MNSQSLLGLLYLSSPSLPIGAFAYSQGLESAIELQLVHDKVSLKDWLVQVMQHNLVRVDIPVLLRCYSAWRGSDSEQVAVWQNWLHANRETQELLLEDQQLGQSMQRLLRNLDHALPVYPTGYELNSKGWSFIPAYSYAAIKFSLSEQQMALGWLWSWLDNQLVVACKTLPLGQTEAQQILVDLMPMIIDQVDIAQALPDDEMGASLMGVALLSSAHETQYSRLFRS